MSVSHPSLRLSEALYLIVHSIISRTRTVDRCLLGLLSRCSVIRGRFMFVLFFSEVVERRDPQKKPFTPSLSVLSVALALFLFRRKPCAGQPQSASSKL